jgi:hypothetical protein
MGINPIQALVVPRVFAAMLVSTMLAALVTMVGIVGAFMFSVFFQHVLPQVMACLVKAPYSGWRQTHRLLQGHLGRWFYRQLLARARRRSDGGAEGSHLLYRGVGDGLRCQESERTHFAEVLDSGFC